jgi:hypothetical protein
MSSNHQTKKENKIRQGLIMVEFTQQNKIEISKILASIEGRLDKRLIKLTMDLILKTSWTKSVAINLYKNNVNNIPDKSLNVPIRKSFWTNIPNIFRFGQKVRINTITSSKKYSKRICILSSFTPYRKVNKLQSIPLILQ